MPMEMNRYLSFTLFTGLSLLTTIPVEAYTLSPNKTATSTLQTNVIEVRSITSVQPSWSIVLWELFPNYLIKYG